MIAIYQCYQGHLYVYLLSELKYLMQILVLFFFSFFFSFFFAVNIVAEKRFSVLLSPKNFSCNVCHSKIARQVARNITMCNTRQHLNLAPWTSPLRFALDKLRYRSQRRSRNGLVTLR